jgi:hypothetical protein
MVRDNTKWIIGIILVLAIIFILFKFNIGLTSRFSILPSGQNNHNSDCSFITNVNDPSGTFLIDDYDYGGSWISFDFNGDGTKEVLGYDGSGTGAVGTNYCETISVPGNYITQTALGGIQIKKLTNQPTVYLCSGNKAVIFSTLSTPYINPSPYLICNPGTCTPNCVGKCGGVSDGCSGTCNAVCSGSQCFSATDLDSSGKMTRNTLGKAINCWIQGL